NSEHSAETVSAHALTRRVRQALPDLANRTDLEGAELAAAALAEASRWQAVPAVAPSPWISTRQIFEYLPPTPWVVPSLAIGPGRPGLLAGYGYAGKTIIGQALLLAAAAGRSVWEHFAIPAAVRVRHFDYEQAAHAARKRYQRLSHGMGIPEDALDGRIEVSIFPRVFLNSKDAEDVYARETEGCGLVLLDALRGATPGDDENDSKIAAC